MFFFLCVSNINRDFNNFVSHFDLRDCISLFTLRVYLLDQVANYLCYRFDGIVRKLHYEVEQNAIVGKPLVDIEQVEASLSQQPTPPATDIKTPEPSGAATPQVSPGSAPPPSRGPEDGRGLLATPAVRRMALEHKVSLSDVRGSGKDGRILKEDVLHHVEELRSGKAPAPASAPAERPAPPSAAAALAAAKAPPAAPSPVAGQPAAVAGPKLVPRLEPSPFASLKPEQVSALIGTNRVEPLRGVRKSMYKSMTAALAIPSFGYMDEVDLGALVSRKAALRAQFAERGLKFSYMPFFVKAASLALHRHPVLNASIDDKGENIVFKVRLYLTSERAACARSMNARRQCRVLNIVRRRRTTSAWRWTRRAAWWCRT